MRKTGTVAGKVADMAPELTVIVGGIVREGLLLASVMLLPAAGAAWFKVTVQVVDELAFTLAGSQDRLVTTMGATKVKLAVWAVLFKLAVTVALCVLVSVPATAAKVAVVAPGVTVTDAGTLKAASLLATATTLPPAGAAWFNVIVQLLEEPEVRLPGLQVNRVKLSGTIVVTEPPVAETGRPAPTVVAPIAFVIPIEVVAVPDASVAVTTAATPF